MRERPVRTLITEPLTRLGIVDEDWKYIVVSTIFALVFSILFVENLYGMILLTPTIFCTGVSVSAFLHKRRPPRWLDHKLHYLLTRLEALALGKHPSLRSPMPSVDGLVLERAPARRQVASPLSVTLEPPQSYQPITVGKHGERFDALEF